MTYDLPDENIDVPQDPEFGQGRDIDAPDWKDTQGVAHWHQERRSSMNVCFWVPGGVSISGSSYQSLTEANGLGGDEDTATFLDPEKPENYHDDFRDGTRLIEILVLMEPDIEGATVKVAMELGRFNKDSSDQQDRRTIQSPAVEVDGSVTSKAWYSQHCVVEKSKNAGPIWGHPVAHADGSEGGVVYAVAVRQIWTVNEQTFSDFLTVFAPYHVADPIPDQQFSDVDPDQATLQLSKAGGDQPNYAAGELSSGTSGYDPVDAIEFGSDDHLSATADSWSPLGFFWAAAFKRNGGTDTIWETKTDAGTSIFEVRYDSTDLYVELETSASIYQISTPHDGDLTWENWAVYWERLGDLRLYKNGKQVASTTTDGSIDVGALTHALGANVGGTNNVIGWVAMPALFTSPFDQIDRQRLLGWRCSYTALFDSDVNVDLIFYFYGEWLRDYLSSQSKSAEAIWELDEEASSTASDLIGNHDGTYSGPTLAESPLVDDDGFSAKFDGSSDYVDVGDKAGLDFGNSTSFSLISWIKTTSSGATIGNMDFDSNNSVWLEGYDLGVAFGGGALVRANDGSSLVEVESTTSVDDGNLHCIVGVLDRGASELQIWVDGTKENTKTAPSGSLKNSVSFQLGQRASGGTYYDGPLDTPAVVPHALNAAEIQKIYDVGVDRANR